MSDDDNEEAADPEDLAAVCRQSAATYDRIARMIQQLANQMNCILPYIIAHQPSDSEQAQWDLLKERYTKASEALSSTYQPLYALAAAVSQLIEDFENEQRSNRGL